MPAANVASMRNALCNKPERRRILSHNPFDAEVLDLLFQSTDRQLELALLQRDGHYLLGKRGTLFVGNKGVQKCKTVLASRNRNGNAIPGPQHRKPAHRPPDCA